MLDHMQQVSLPADGHTRQTCPSMCASSSSVTQAVPHVDVALTAFNPSRRWCHRDRAFPTRVASTVHADALHARYPLRASSCHLRTYMRATLEFHRVHQPSMQSTTHCLLLSLVGSQPTMNELKSRISSRIFPPADPSHTVSIKVQKKALQSAANNSIRKRDWYDRYLPLPTRRRVLVEASEFGTTDSILFAPEHPNVSESHQRVTPTEFVKVSRHNCPDLVHTQDNFEISFVGLSVSQQDYIGDNELLLCSLARKQDLHDEPRTSSLAAFGSEDNASLVTDNRTVNVTGESISEKEFDTTSLSARTATTSPNNNKIDLNDLPTALPIRPGDVPFLHYDPETDGHDTGSEPDSFVPIPGTKRLFIQRRGSVDDAESGSVRDVSVRFTVMEIDKLNEEQLIAIKSLEEVAKSVGKASSTVPYLKFIAWLLKFANAVGRSALKKVARPDHVMSADVNFMLAQAEGRNKNDDSRGQREEYGNYLRYGYYFFLSGPVDAKLYAQTGASSQNVQLLLHRHGYRARSALQNEKEYFPLAGVSYVVIKVSRGCSPYDKDEREDLYERHRGRLTQLLKKYTGTLGCVAAEVGAGECSNKSE